MTSVHEREALLAGNWEIRTLGHFDVIETATGRSVPITSKKARAILTALAVEPGQKISRTWIIGLLWPDSEESLARQSLRQVLTGLRRDLGRGPSEPISITDETIELTAGVVTDVATLSRKAATVAELEIAIQNYRGELGHDLGAISPDFTDWLIPEQERYRSLAIHALVDIIRRLSDEKQIDRAYHHALNLYAVDPLREESHRILLELEAIAAGRASALARFETIKKHLAQELGVNPERATEDLIEQIRTNDPGPRTTEVSSTALPGSTVSLTVHAGKRRPFPALYPLVIALLCVTFAGGAIAFRIYQPTQYIADAEGRISVAVMPFRSSEIGAQSQVEEFQQDIAHQLLAIQNLSVVQSRSAGEEADATKLGRALRTRYVLLGHATGDGEHQQLRMRLLESESGDAVFTQAISIDRAADTTKRRNIANQWARTIYKDMFLDRAQRIKESDAELTASLLIRAEASSLRGRFVSLDENERPLYERILEREPNNFLALKGFSRHLVLGVASERSTNRQDDLRLAAELIERSNRVRPNNVHGVFMSAMIDKLSRRFEQALHGFQRAIELDTTYPQAQIHAAHVLAMLGRPDEAFPIMLDAFEISPRDFSVGSTSYIAAETALLAQKDEDAVRWLRLAIQENPTAARAHALLAAALQLTGRTDEAILAAKATRNLNSSYTPDVMRRRGGATAHPIYKARQDRYVSAFAAAYNGIPASTQ